MKTTKNTTKKNTNTKRPYKKSTKKEVSTFTIAGRKINKKLTAVVAFSFAILLIFSSYAWFSTNLNVNIRTFKMSVNRDSDLQISFDGINYDYTIEVTEDLLLNTLQNTYPNHRSQWVGNGFIPVSSAGIPHSNTHYFDFFETSGVLYHNKKMENGFVYTYKSDESTRRTYNYYLAFDIFIKNKTGSPYPDNFYLEPTTSIIASDPNTEEEMLGLVNSFRMGIVKVGSVPHDTPVNDIQNITCNNDCKSVIYEPNSKEHTALSIERASKFQINVQDGFKYSTYAFTREGGPYYIQQTIPGTPTMDYNANYVRNQNTITEEDFDNPIFTIENGVTKARIYIWIEGQDIDSLETNSAGTDVNIRIDFLKDTAGYEGYDS